MKSVKELWRKLTSLAATDQPEHLRRGQLGERAAKAHLQKQGLKFLTANFRSAKGEIDLVFRDQDCLLFVLFTRNIFQGNFSLHEAKASDQLRPVQHH
jgi:Holliday junction resolvase-like predicted endonuclease